MARDVMGRRRPICLRLDNGSIIGDRSALLADGVSGVVFLPVEKVHAIGRLTEKDAQRFERCVASISEPSHLNGGSHPPNGLAQPEVDPSLPPNKRPRHSQQNGFPQTDVVSPSSRPKQTMSGDFAPKCLDILKGLRKELGQQGASLFNQPVDPRAVPDYHAIIKRPMDLGTIETKLQRGKYSSPQEFCEDMRLVWSNCHKYNGDKSDVGRLGLRGKETFERFWTSCDFGVDSGRTKRATAGVAAEKFDPGLEPAPSKTRSVSKGNKNGSKHKNGIARSKSHEVTSGHQDIPKSIPPDRLQFVAEAIQSLEDEAVLHEALTLFNEEAKVISSEDGEMELDFAQLHPGNFIKLEKYLQSVSKQRQGGRLSSPVSGKNGSVYLEQGESSVTDDDSLES